MIDSFRKNVLELDKVHLSVMFLLTLSFILSDWMISAFAVSEIIMGFILVIILVNDSSSIKNINYRFIVLLLSFFAVQFTYNMSVDMIFVFRRAIFNVVKVLFYVVFINSVYNYIKKQSLEKNILVFLNSAALIVIMLGIYITLAILYFDQWPYEFLWTFTRSDLHSYRFRGPGFIIRTRSVFSEPAHLGYFLNIVLTLNLFSKFKKSIPYWLNGVIIAGVLITFSYASIGVMGLVLLIKIALLPNKKELLRQNYLIIIVSGIIGAVMVFVFWDYFYQTIIMRTTDILSGGDNSAFVRLINSWLYISWDTLLLGRGLGHTPPLQNVYAYYLSDTGVIPFAASLMFTYYLIKYNTGIGLSFLLLNFQKGGYLSPIFNLYLLIVLLYVYDKNVLKSFLHRKE